MSTIEIHAQVKSKLDEVRAALAREISVKKDVCLTCSFQAEDVLLAMHAFRFSFSIPAITSPRPMPIATAWQASGN